MPSHKEVHQIAEQFHEYLEQNDLKAQIGSSKDALTDILRIKDGEHIIWRMKKYSMVRTTQPARENRKNGNEIKTAQKVRQLLASSPSGWITGADFKKAYADNFSEELDLKGGKLKDLLSRCEAMGACRLEDRPMPKGPNSLFVHTVDTHASSTRRGSASGSTCGGSDSPAAVKAAYELKAAQIEAEKIAAEEKLAVAEAARAALELKAAGAESAMGAAEKKIAAAEAAKAAAENWAYELELANAIAASNAEALQAASLRASSAKNAAEEKLEEEKISQGELAPVWSCEIDDHKWVAYDDAIASKLEIAYQARMQPGFHQTNDPTTWSQSGNTYAINWDFMVQVNAQTTKARSVKREVVPNAKHSPASGGSSKQWISVQEEVLSGNVSRHKISASTLSASVDSKELYEFNFAAGQLLRLQGGSNGGQRVSQVDVYENKALEERWNSKRRELGDSAGNPFWVFHGTDAANIDRIMTGGFKVGGKDGVPIVNGSAYGQGVYTAAGPSVPLGYGRGKSVILALGLGGKPGTNSTRPNGDWVIFCDGTQLLPMYVLHMQ